MRSSATAEDLPDASFAGQQETFLNVRGIDDVLHGDPARSSPRSTTTARSPTACTTGFEHADVALSAGVQRMVRSDVGASGVMFTMDTESGFHDVVFITSSLRPGRDGRAGRGEPGRVLRLQAGAAGRPARRSSSAASASKATKMVYTERAAKSGRTTEFVDVDGGRARAASASPTTRSSELARHALMIEEHYGRPMDIEWGKDGVDGKLYILQARPETVKSRQAARQPERATG